MCTSLDRAQAKTSIMWRIMIENTIAHLEPLDHVDQEKMMLQSWQSFQECWLLTAGPLIGLTVLFAELSKRKDCKRVVEYLHRHEEIKIVTVHLCFLICLHFSTGHHHRCGVPGSLQSLHFVWAQIFFGSACALTLWGQPRILVLLEILKWAPALPWLQ